MSSKLFVTNLPSHFGDSDLGRLFTAHGNVVTANVAIDRKTGRSKGYGFVEMSSEAEARSAIKCLNGKEVGGRSLIVVEGQNKPALSGKRRSARTSPRKPAPLGKRLRRPRVPEEGS
jgi:RNA recognition motif-containing protein